MDLLRRVLVSLPENDEFEGLALEAPEQLNDPYAGLVCPNCHELAEVVGEVENAEVEPSLGTGLDEEPRVILCIHCGSTFSPPVASALIDQVVENRRRARLRIEHAPISLDRDRLMRLYPT